MTAQPPPDSALAELRVPRCRGQNQRALPRIQRTTHNCKLIAHFPFFHYLILFHLLAAGCHRRHRQTPLCQESPTAYRWGSPLRGDHGNTDTVEGSIMGSPPASWEQSADDDVCKHLSGAQCLLADLCVARYLQNSSVTARPLYYGRLEASRNTQPA